MQLRLLLVFVLLLPIGLQAGIQSPDSIPYWLNNVSINETVDLLTAYIQRESVSGNEQEAAMFIEDYILSTDLHLRVFSNLADQYNLAASLFPLDSLKPNIILQSHIDVVPAEAFELWDHDPYSGHFDGIYIYGRGSLDAKGLGIMQLKALETFKKEYGNQDMPYNVTVLFVSGEETGGRSGATFVLENFKDELNAEVVLGEGGAGYRNVLKSDPEKVIFGVSIAEKQSLWLQLKITSQSAGHGAAPSNNYANLQLINSLS